MNGISSIYQSTLMRNRTDSFNQTKRGTKIMMPKGSMSGAAELEAEQKSGLSIQMNADKDTFAFSGQIKVEETKGPVDRYIADMGKKEQEDLAKEYLRKAQEIEEQFKNGEITQEERQDLQSDLRDLYKVDHTIEAFTTEGEEICTKVLFKDEKGRNSKDPTLINSKIEVDLTGKREQIYAGFDGAASIISPTVSSVKGDSAKENNSLMEAVTGEGETKLSSQLIKNLMKDYMYQSDKTVIEKQKERIQEKHDEAEKAEQQQQLKYFEAFA